MKKNRVEIGPWGLAAAAVFALAALAGAVEAAEPGTLLIADRELKDPNFKKTVVLLLVHNEGGAMGLVINRPSGASLSSVLPDFEGADRAEVHMGGPVARDSFRLLLQSADEIEGAEPLFEDVHVSRNESVLRRVLLQPTSRFRIYAGYAGWAPGQLEIEIERGDWHLAPASARLIFDHESGTLWDELLPADPSLLTRTWSPMH